MNKFQSCCLSLAIIFVCFSSAKAECLSYEPAEVSLSGILYTHTDYGPPNYGEDPETDSKELHYYLKLDSPICTIAEPDDEYEIRETNLTNLQLSYLYGSSVPSTLIDRHVSVSGKLFHAHTAHHHTAVLINADAVHLTSHKQSKEIP